MDDFTLRNEIDSVISPAESELLSAYSKSKPKLGEDAPIKDDNSKLKELLLNKLKELEAKIDNVSKQHKNDEEIYRLLYSRRDALGPGQVATKSDGLLISVANDSLKWFIILLFIVALICVIIYATISIEKLRNKHDNIKSVLKKNPRRSGPLPTTNPSDV